jgi:prepilin-type N-terminal cleavage/methylation domain-containing protein
MFFRHRDIDGQDAGFSLAELLVATSLMGVILAAAYLVIGSVTAISDQIIARENAQSTGQLAMEKMTREIRQAQKVQDSATSQDVYFGAQPTGTSLIFYGDIDHNGWLERVTYRVSGGQLTRAVANSTKQLAPTNADFGPDSAPVVMAKVDPALTTFFTPQDANSAPTAVMKSMTAVQLNLRTVAKSGNTSQTVNFPPVWVEIRSYGPGFGIN